MKMTDVQIQKLQELLDAKQNKTIVTHIGNVKCHLYRYYKGPHYRIRFFAENKINVTLQYNEDKKEWFIIPTRKDISVVFISDCALAFDFLRVVLIDIGVIDLETN